MQASKAKQASKASKASKQGKQAKQSKQAKQASKQSKQSKQASAFLYARCGANNEAKRLDMGADGFYFIVNANLRSFNGRTRIEGAALLRPSP